MIRHSANDDGGMHTNARTIFTAHETGTYHIVAGNSLWRATPGDTYRVSVTETTDNDDYGVDADSAGTITPGTSVRGSLEHAGDRDWFAVEFQQGHEYQIDLIARGWWWGGDANTKIHGVYNADGTRMPNTTEKSPAANTSAQVTFIAPQTATYYVEVGHVDGMSYGYGDYELEVEQTSDGTDRGDIAAEVGVTVSGSLDERGERDWITIELEADTEYRVSVEGSPTGAGTLGDTYLYGVYAPDGVKLPGSRDDDDGVGANSFAVITTNEAGTYRIEVGAWEVGGGRTGTYTVRVDPTPTAPEQDAAADTSTTASVEVGGATVGALDHDGDVDWMAVVLEAGSTYRIDVKGDEITDYGGTLHNPSLVMYDSDGNAILLASDDNAGTGRNARLDGFSPDVDGTYYIEIADPGGVGTYTVSVEETIEAI